MRLYCDNDEALSYTPLDNATYTTLTKRDIDIKLEVQHVQSTSPITFVFSQVSDHADDSDDFDYDQAPHEVKQNFDMDSKSKEMVALMKKTTAPSSLPTFHTQK